MLRGNILMHAEFYEILTTIDYLMNSQIFMNFLYCSFSFQEIALSIIQVVYSNVDEP